VKSIKDQIHAAFVRKNANRIIGYRKTGAPIFAIAGAADEDPIERLEARNREILAELEVLNEEIGEADKPEIRSGKETEFSKLETEFAGNEAKIEEHRSEVKARETRSARLAAARAKYGAGPQVRAGNDNSLARYELRAHEAIMDDPQVHSSLVSRGMKVLDDDGLARHLRSDQKERIEKIMRTKTGDTDGQLIAAYLIATSNPHYRSAFLKATTGERPVFTAEEGRAIMEVQSLQRAMSIGTGASGGFAVPVVLDPTIILTSQGSSNAILQRARIETITNNQWKGIASAGASWQFNTEGGTATDNSPSISNPVVDCYRADGFIPYSIEIGMDWPGFAEEMSAMLGRGYRELLAEKLTTGSAANTPRGLVSRLVLQTSPDVSTATTTAGTLAAADIYAMWARLPERHRDEATWLSSTSVQNGIRQLGTVDPNFTVNITQGSIPSLFARDYPMNDYMDSLATGTAAANELIVGNFRGYLVAQRAGMTIEFVPMLFDVTNNRPTGQRGWYAFARVGADVVDPTAFQLLQNKTA
jgi:HK97 family phage major capsid protein